MDGLLRGCRHWLLWHGSDNEWLSHERVQSCLWAGVVSSAVSHETCSLFTYQVKYCEKTLSPFLTPAHTLICVWGHIFLCVSGELLSHIIYLSIPKFLTVFYYFYPAAKHIMQTLSVKVCTSTDVTEHHLSVYFYLLIKVCVCVCGTLHYCCSFLFIITCLTPVTLSIQILAFH